MADVGIRDYLKGRGYKDDEITYNNGNVMLKNKSFISATPQADGSTYGDPTQLNKAFNNYNNQGYLDQRNNIMGQVEQRINTPPPQFNYDRNTDPLYQNALTSAKQNAQTAGNNATVRLGARGIGNSQQALTTENQIQQQEFGRVERDIAPQLYNQAYNQYKDKYAMDQDGLKNLLGLGDAYNNMYNQGREEEQQGFNNDRLTASDARQKQNDHLDYAQMLSDKFGVYVEPKDDPMLALEQVKGLKPISERTHDEGREDVKFNQNIATKQLDNSTRSTNNSIANSNDSKTKSNDVKNLESEVYDHAQEFESAQDVNDYFKANGAYLAKTLGSTGVTQLKTALLSQYSAEDKSADAGNKANTALYEKAFDAAQRDIDWIGLSDAERQARINKYLGMLSNR